MNSSNNKNSLYTGYAFYRKQHTYPITNRKTPISTPPKSFPNVMLTPTASLHILYPLLSISAFIRSFVENQYDRPLRRHDGDHLALV